MINILKIDIVLILIIHLGMLLNVLLFKSGSIRRRDFSLDFLTGVTVVIVFYALFRSSFHTMLIAILPVFGFMAVKSGVLNRTFRTRFDTHAFLKYSLFLCCFILPISFVSAWAINHFDISIFSNQYSFCLDVPDYTHYSRMAEALNRYGREGYYIYTGPVSQIDWLPYHYGNEWFCAFLYKVTGVHYLSLTGVYIPIIWSAGAYLSIYSLLHSKLKISPPALLGLSAFIVLFAGTYWFYPNFGLFKTDPVQQNLFTFPKLSIVVCFVCMYLRFILLRKHLIATATLLILCILYLPVAPAVLSIHFLFLFLKHKSAFFRESYFLLALIFAAGLIAFLVANMSSSALSASETDHHYDFHFIKTKINILVKTLIYTLVLCSPILLLLKKAFRKKNKDELLLFILAAVIPVLIYAMFSQQTDSFQLWANILSLPVIISILVFALNVTAPSPLFYGGLTIMCLSVCFLIPPNKKILSVSNQTIDQIRSKLKESGYTGYFAYDIPMHEPMTFFEKNPYYYSPMLELFFADNNYFPVLCNIDQLRADKKTEFASIINSRFDKYKKCFVITCNDCKFRVLEGPPAESIYNNANMGLIRMK
jgi:hypothetical protein